MVCSCWCWLLAPALEQGQFFVLSRNGVIWFAGCFLSLLILLSLIFSSFSTLSLNFFYGGSYRLSHNPCFSVGQHKRLYCRQEAMQANCDLTFGKLNFYLVKLISDKSQALVICHGSVSSLKNHS